MFFIADCWVIELAIKFTILLKPNFVWGITSKIFNVVINNDLNHCSSQDNVILKLPFYDTTLEMQRGGGGAMTKTADMNWALSMLSVI